LRLVLLDLQHLLKTSSLVVSVVYFELQILERDKQMRRSFAWIIAGIFATSLVVGCSNEEAVPQTTGAPGPAGISYKPDPTKANIKGAKKTKPSAPTGTSPSKD
jgi:hypothetical protein